MVQYNDVNRRNPLYREGMTPTGTNSVGGSSGFRTSAYGNALPSSYSAPEPWRRSEYANPHIPVNNPQKQVWNYQQRLQQVGIEAPEREERGLKNALMTALDYLQRPQSAITNMILEGMKPGQQTGGEILGAAWRGLSGKQHSSVQDIFTEAGWNPETGGGKVAKGVLGFVGDVLLDPTTYLTLGTGAVAKGLTTAGAKAAASRLSVRGADTLAGNLAKTLGMSADDVMAQAGKHGAARDFTMELAERMSATDVSEARRILQYGANKDNIGQYQRTLREQLDDALGIQKRAEASRNRSQGQLFRELTGTEFDLGDLAKRQGPDARESFVGRLTSIFDDAQTPRHETLDKRRETLSRLLGGEISDDTAKLWSPREVDLLADMYDVFPDVPIARTLEVADNLFNSMKSKSGGFKNVQGLARRQQEVEAARRRVKKIENGIEFANGLQQVYDAERKAMKLRFMGKDFMDVTVLRKGAEKVTDALMSVRPIQETVDSLGRMFKPGYIRQGIKREDPQLYESLKKVRDSVTTFIREQTGIPFKALQMASSAFSGIEGFLTNSKLMEGAAYYIERNLSENAMKAWNNWLAKNPLSPDEMHKIKEAQVVNSLLNEATDNLDKMFDIEMFKDSYELIEGGYESYVKHMYKQDPKKVQEIMRGLSQKDLESTRMRFRASHTLSRQFDSMADAAVYTEGQLNPVYNVVTSASLRYLDSLHLKINKLLHKDLLDAAKSDPALKGLISTKPGPGLREVESLKLWVAPEVGEQINRISDFLVADHGQEHFIKWADSVTNFMKTLQTSYNPSFLIRNAIGEPLMNVIAGVNPVHYSTAAEILADTSHRRLTLAGDDVLLDGKPLMRLRTKEIDGKKVQVIETGEAHSINKGKKPARWEGDAINLAEVERQSFYDAVREELKNQGFKTYNIGGKEYTAVDFMNVFRDSGLGWSGVTKGNLVENMSDTLKREITRVQGGIRKIMEAPRQFGDNVETMTRLSHLIDRLERGLPISEAARDVRLYHVDYRDLTPIERNTMRRIMPYYTYMRKNLPIQLRLMLTKPGWFSALGHLTNNSYQALRDHQGKDVATPDYLKETLALPLWADGENVRYLNWNLPLADVSRLQYDIGELFQMNVVDMLHPMLKAPFEMAANRNFSLGMPIEKYEGERAPLLPGWEEGPRGLPRQADYLFQQFGVAEQIRRTLGQQIASATGQPEDPLKPRQLPMLSSILPTRSQSATLNSMAYQHRDELQAYIRRLEEQGYEIPQYSPPPRPPRPRHMRNYSSTYRSYTPRQLY